MPGPNSQVVSADGSMDFSGGVNSLRVTTIQSDLNPNGLPRNCLAWLINANVRDGGISCRTGWRLLGTVHSGINERNDKWGGTIGAPALYQGGGMYSPRSGDPYLLLSIAGEILLVYPDDASNPINLTNGSYATLVNPPDVVRGYWCEGEEFGIWQCGDYLTPSGANPANPAATDSNGCVLPLFWDGATLWRSKGITNYAVPAGTPGVNEIPSGGPMDYYMGRLWYSGAKKFFAGDIVGGQSGTVAYGFRNAILNVTENPLVLNTTGGDGFAVPDNSGNIRVLTHNAQLNSTLGQGQLLIGTRKAVYAMDVPVTRSDWTSADATKAPKQTVVQLVNGPVNDRATLRVNGDVFYWTLDPTIASLMASVRYFNQWGNRAISGNVRRVLEYQDRSLMHGLSGIVFDNRMLMGAMPILTVNGIAAQCITPLDFVPISEFAADVSPIWQGIYEDLLILQLFVGDFGGRERAFALIVSRVDATIQLWELTDYLKSDFDATGERRTTWIIEWPAFTWGDSFKLKQLAAGELWLDKIFGEVVLKLQYRVDQDPCWYDWHTWKHCVARNACEKTSGAQCYPYPTGLYREGFAATVTLPRPLMKCQALSGRPTTVGYQFQPRLEVTGWARVRGILLYAEPHERSLYSGLAC